MISLLKIQNFQSHRRTVLKFGKGVNAIVGRSHSGKSAVLRALRWVSNPRVAGTWFRSHWGGLTKVMLKTGEGVRVFRTRGKSKKDYFLNKEKLGAVGTHDDNPVSRALNMNELNWQLQFDRPFLLDCSPGEVASKLNDYMNFITRNAVIFKIDNFDGDAFIVTPWQ